MKEKYIIDNFKGYVDSIGTSKFLVELINNEQLCDLIIDNNLFWENIRYISSKFYDKKFEMFKLLYARGGNKLLNNDMGKIITYEYSNTNFFKQIIDFVELKSKHNFSIEKFIDGLLKSITKPFDYEFIEYLFNSKYKNIFINNFDIILNNCYCLAELKGILKDDLNLLKKYEEFVNNDPSNLIYGMIINGFHSSLEEIKEEKIYLTIKTIIDEVMKYENVNYSDIEYIGFGGTSTVYSIGNKVLKLGEERDNFVMENNKRFLKPILRTNIDKINGEGILGCVEIVEKVNTEGITEKHVYKLYKELKDSGYMWFDPRFNNVGRLMRKNKIYFDDLSPVKEAVNYKTDNDIELSKGQLVILDNEYIYSKEEFEKLPKSRQELYLDAMSDYEEELKRRNK